VSCAEGERGSGARRHKGVVRRELLGELAVFGPVVVNPPPLAAGAFLNEAQLMAAAIKLAGFTLGELAAGLDCALPDEPARHKGFIGRCVERALGLPLQAAVPRSQRGVRSARGAATAARTSDARPFEPDFAALGIELKTLPVSRNLRPRESTFVCHARLSQLVDTAWEEARVALKLARVLFLPIESEPGLGFAQRRIGRAFLWSADAEQDAILRGDYAEIVRCIAEGHVEVLNARIGRALQLRPKAAHGAVRVRISDPDGAPLLAMPRAFYLRASFTEQLLRAALADQPPAAW
jgi:DNA mismatch repair protein MutH